MILALAEDGDEEEAILRTMRRKERNALAGVRREQEKSRADTTDARASANRMLFTNLPLIK